MPAPSCRSPTASPRRCAGSLGELCAAAGLRGRGRARRRCRSTRRGSRGRRHLLARRGGARGAVDEHGRFPASASALAAGAAPVDDLVVALRERGRGRRREPAPALARRRALLRRAHARHRHALALDARGLRGAAAASSTRSRDATRAAARVEARGLARVPLHQLRGSDPNWSLRRFAELERGAASRSTSYVLAAHRDPHDGAAPEAYAARRPRLVRELARSAARSACTAATPPGATRRCCARAAELEVLLGGPVRGHPLPLPAHALARGIRRSTGSASSTTRTLGFSDRPGPRAGFSFPFRPWDHAAGSAAALPRAAAAADGRDARRVALHGPLARGGRKEVDACSTGSQRRRRRRERPLAQRPLRPRLRARLGRRLRAPARRHRRARRHAGTGAALCDWWRAERCAS